MDVKSALLNDNLKEVVYVHQPSGFAIPGMEGNRHRGRGMPSWIPHSRGWASREARMRWPSTGGAMEEMPCWWVSTSRVITGTKDVEVAVFKEEMKATFQMSDLGLLSFYLGSRCTRTTPGSRFDRLPMPIPSLSKLGSPTATQLSLRWRRG